LAASFIPNRNALIADWHLPGVTIGPSTRAMRYALMSLLEFSMRALLIGIDSLLEIYCWILIAVSTLHLLSGFNLIDTDKNYLAVINTYLEKATALPLWPVRKILPDLGAVDISPMVLILMLMSVRYAIALNAWPEFF
jgi:YggT family protein